MPIYILLSRLSQQGVQTLQSNPSRLQEVNRDVEELGAKVLHQWATLGEFDFVNVVEAPDAATIARVSVALGARGTTRIETASPPSEPRTSPIAARQASGRSPIRRWPQPAIVRSGARRRRAYSMPSSSRTQLSLAPHRQRQGQRTRSSCGRGSVASSARPAEPVSVW